jgi:hypothetical protein
MKRVYPELTALDDTGRMDDPSSPLTPDAWLAALFASKAARDGMVIRRKARDIERYAGWHRFRAEIERRGWRAVENSGQIVIFCNRAPIRPLYGADPAGLPVSFKETGPKSLKDFGRLWRRRRGWRRLLG